MSSREQLVLDQYRNKAFWQPLDSVTESQTTNQLNDLALKESCRRIRTTLQSLPRLERKAVEATVMEGLSLRAAGQRFHVSAMTVQRRLKRGLQRMAITLQSDQLSL